VQIVLRRFVEKPDVPLVTGTTPEMVCAFAPAIEDGFVLALIIGAPQGEGVLGPDDEGGPFATSVTKGLLQRI
jgi:hypothetical protein